MKQIKPHLSLLFILYPIKSNNIKLSFTELGTAQPHLFHYAVRRVKKMSKSLRARKLLDASESGSVDLLSEMKKIKGGKKVHADLPECLAGVSGEANIVEAFKNVYSELYNSSSTSD